MCLLDGTVDCGHCTCMAGLREVCSHVAAILFYLESAARSKLTCTQTSCMWKEPTFVDAIPYLPISELPLSKPKPRISCNKRRGAHHLSDITPFEDMFQVAEELPVSEHPSTSSTACQSTSSLLCVPPSAEEQMVFLRDIAHNRPAICSIVPPFSNEFKPTANTIQLPPSLLDLYNPENEELLYTELLEVCDELQLSVRPEEVQNIEVYTQEQAKSPAWFKQRAGRITASKMKAVCATDPSHPSQSLLSQICYPHLKKFTTPATTWGCEHEAVARLAYIEMMKPMHTNFQYRNSGFVVSTEYPYIGASPDGVVQCDCCGCGVLEIKCPYCVRESTPDEAPYLNNGKLSEKHEYYYQVQTQLLVCSANYADFVIATVSDASPNLSCERIFLNESFIEHVKAAEKFFKICLLPELLAMWYSRKAVMPDQTAAASVVSVEYTYCYCKEDKGGEMVGCDNPNCLHGSWFHLECLKIPKPRSSKWYCPNCRTMPEFSRKRQRTKQ